MIEKQYVMTVTRDGQVTIPADIRKMLGLGPDQPVAFEVEGDEVRIKPAKLTPDAVYDVAKRQSTPEVFERLTEAYQTMLASEGVLRRDWDSPEEDAAWANL